MLLVGPEFAVSGAVIQTSLYDLPLPPQTQVTPIVLAGISVPDAATIQGSGYSVTFNVGAGQGVVNGSNGIHAIPVAGVSGTTPEYLTGDVGSALSSDPALAGNYLSTGTGTITIAFSAPQTSFSLLWGSIDVSNLLSFNDADGSVVTGDQIEAAAAGFAGEGFRGAGGSAYVTVFSSEAFTAVTASSGVPSFEFAALEGDAPLDMPEPPSLWLVVSGVGVVAGLGVRRLVW